jgi:phosphodiesterase/alkaline phosphatase D-like protein
MKRFLRHPGDQAIDPTDSEVFWVDDHDHSNRVDGIAEAQAQPGRPAQQSPSADVTAAPISAFPNDLSSGEVTETFAVAGSSQGLTFDPAGASAAAFPDGVSSGDVTQTSAVLWTRATELGDVTFQIATDPSFHHVRSEHALVTDPLVPVKVEFDHLRSDETYYYRVVEASGDVLQGSFHTAAELGVHRGFHFGIVADERAPLAPFVAAKNAAAAGLELVVKLGDTIYADFPLSSPPSTTLDEFRLKHDAVYSTHLGFDFLADLQAVTPVLSMIDDAEVRNDFAGGAPPASDPRFAGQTGDFINETALYANGIEAFNEYNAIENRTYSGTGEDRFDGAPDLYRYNTYGSDAAIIMVDARSFRDTELPAPANPFSPTNVGKFLSASFDASRSMLGDVQLQRLEQDLLDARDKGITWKFVMLGEPIQNFGPNSGDRYEGYAAERDALLKFIDDNHVENVVFVSSDHHWTSVNNLTYQDALGGPQIASTAFEVNTLAVAAPSAAPLLPAAAFQLGLITAQQLALYNSLPNAPDSDSIPNDKDDFVKLLIDTYMTRLGYDPIGLEPGGKINATLLQGDYFVGHDYGWTDFNIGTDGKLLVTTWGIPAYSAEQLAADPASVLSLTPAIVSQFEVTPTSQSIIGTAKSDQLQGTPDADVILGAAGNDLLYGLGGDDYLDGGKDNDTVFGGGGADRLFGREGNDALYGQDGDDRIDGGPGNDVLDGGPGNDVLTGGTGNDLIIGGPGNDSFVSGKDLGHDTVLDFQAAGAAHDSITFSKSVFADWTALAGAISDGPDGAVITVDAHNAITLVGVTAAEVIANHTNDFFFVDPPTASMGGSSLVQAMAGFGGGSGAADSLNSVALGADTSQQTLLTTPQQHA